MFFALVLNSLRLLMRQKLSGPLFLLAAVALPFVSYFVFSADGTLTGVLKMMWGWQFYVSAALLMLVTVYLAASVLESELRGFQMLNTAVKPAPRWLVLLAKLTAVCLISGAGTAAAGASSCLALRLRARAAAVVAIRRESPDTLRFSDAERARDAEEQQKIAAANFFVSRVSRYPDTPDFLREFRERLAKMKPEDFPNGQRPSEQEMRDAAMKLAMNKKYDLPYAAGREFVFRRLPRSAAPLTVRYKFGGTHRSETLGWLQAFWQFSGTGGQPPYDRETAFRRNVEQEFAVPGGLIGDDGVLRAALFNASGPTGKAPAAELEVPFDGVRVMVPHSAFATNFARAWLLLWCRLCLIAAIGVGFSPIVGGPVNGFLLVAALFVGFLNSSARAELAPPFNPYRPTATAPLDQAKRLAAGALKMLPDFSETDRVDAIGGGTEISWGETAAQFGRDLLLRGGAAMLIGAWAFRRRELAIYRG